MVSDFEAPYTKICKNCGVSSVTTNADKLCWSCEKADNEILAAKIKRQRADHSSHWTAMSNGRI